MLDMQNFRLASRFDAQAKSALLRPNPKLAHAVLTLVWQRPRVFGHVECRDVMNLQSGKSERKEALVYWVVRFSAEIAGI
jgi:hypothetical protein